MKVSCPTCDVTRDHYIRCPICQEEIPEPQMKIICVCGKEFNMENSSWVLPNHTKSDGSFCSGSFVMGNKYTICLSGIIQIGDLSTEGKGE